MNLLGVMAGGALGALARYLMMLAFVRTPYAGTGVATLLVNVSGSFLLAFLVTLAAQGRLSPFWVLALGTGFTGAFTTFSTFELEAHTFIKTGQLGTALAYILGSLVLGYGALLLGVLLGERLTLGNE